MTPSVHSSLANVVLNNQTAVTTEPSADVCQLQLHPRNSSQLHLAQRTVPSAEFLRNTRSFNSVCASYSLPYVCWILKQLSFIQPVVLDRSQFWRVAGRGRSLTVYLHYRFRQCCILLHYYIKILGRELGECAPPAGPRESWCGPTCSF